MLTFGIVLIIGVGGTKVADLLCARFTVLNVCIIFDFETIIIVACHHQTVQNITTSMDITHYMPGLTRPDPLLEFASFALSLSTSYHWWHMHSPTYYYTHCLHNSHPFHGVQIQGEQSHSHLRKIMDKCTAVLFRKRIFQSTLYIH